MYIMYVISVMKSINEPTMLKTTSIFLKKSRNSPFETSAFDNFEFSKMFLHDKDTYYFLNSQELLKFRHL